MSATVTGTATGISVGTVVLVGGAILVGGAVIYYLSQTNKEKRTKKYKKLVSDEHRYESRKDIILTAIKEKDWETLEDMLDSSTRDFPDLIKMIEKALKDR